MSSRLRSKGGVARLQRSFSGASDDITPTIGELGEPLNGVELRVQRTRLNLDLFDVALLVTELKLWIAPMTPRALKIWERADTDICPAAISDMLRRLDKDVDLGAMELCAGAVRGGPQLTLHRPRTPADLSALPMLAEGELLPGTADVEMDDAFQPTWEHLVDAALSRALAQLTGAGWKVRLVRPARKPASRARR